MRSKSRLAVGLACALCIAVLRRDASAQISFTGAQYIQDFNSLPSTGTFILSGNGPFDLSVVPIHASGLIGWQFGKLTGTGANALFRVDDGDGNTGSIYSYGLAPDEPNNGDRALGSLASGGVVSAFGAVFINDSASTFRNVSISLIGEQWRTTTAAANTLTFSYGVGANDIFDSADLTNYSSLNFTSVVVASDGRLNGNDPVNQANVSATIGGFDWCRDSASSFVGPTRTKREAITAWPSTISPLTPSVRF